MSFWTAAVVIVAILALVHLKLEKYRAIGGHRRGRRTAASELEPPRAELEREIVELKKRLAVLERIATADRESLTLSEQIEQLRDR